MKIQFILLVILLSFLPYLASTQNLVPNGGFEEYDNNVSPGYLDPLNDWFKINGTPDHHHISYNSSGSWLTSVDTSCTDLTGALDCGYPFDGSGVLGLYKANGINGSREWAGCHLLDTLEVGSCYDISFYAENKKNKPEFLMETNQWGVFFSETEFPFFRTQHG